MFFAFSLDSRERARDKWIGCNSNAHCFALTRTPRRTRGNVDAFKRDITRLVTAVSLLPCKWTNEIPKHIFYTISNRFMILRYRHRNDSTEKDLYSYFNSFDDNFSIWKWNILLYTLMNIVQICKINIVIASLINLLFNKKILFNFLWKNGTNFSHFDNLTKNEIIFSALVEIK